MDVGIQYTTLEDGTIHASVPLFEFHAFGQNEDDVRAVILQEIRRRAERFDREAGVHRQHYLSLHQEADDLWALLKKLQPETIT